MSPSDLQFPCPVRRVRLVWRDGQWQMQKQLKIASMTLPQSAPLPEVAQERGVSGFWFETVNAQGQTLYRRILDDSALSVEVVGFQAGTLTRSPAESGETFVDVLVPDVPELEELLLYASEQPQQETQGFRRSGPARVVAAFSLRDNEPNREAN